MPETRFETDDLQCLQRITDLCFPLNKSGEDVVLLPVIHENEEEVENFKYAIEA